MSAAEREARAMRATGTAFEILYQPRAVADSQTPPQKRGPKPAAGAAKNSAPNFNVPIAKTQDTVRRQAIQGKL